MSNEPGDFNCVTMPKLYRYETSPYGFSTIGLELETFVPYKETPKGWWISRDGLGWSKNKWVAKTGVKRFAYETRELALESYIKRKTKMLEKLRNSLAQTETALSVVVAIKEGRATDETRVGNPTYRWVSHDWDY